MLEATGFGEVVPARDLTAARCAVEALTEDGERREWIREMAPTWVRTMFSVPDYAAFIGRLIENKDAAAHQTWPVPDWAGSVRALSCGWGSPTWKLRLRDDLRGLRRAIARGENPHSWMFPWGELRFQRADTIPSQIEDIVENQHYRIETEQPIRRIVDGGGNIGLSALWFARTYPEAIIEVFEADPSLAGLCHRNLEAAGVAGARVLTAALWNRDGEIPFAASGDDRGHVSLVSSHARVPCRDIAEVVDSGVDLLKLDIEGAEFECLERLIETRAIRRVRHLVVEIHLSQAVAARAYRVLAALAEEGFATAFEAVIRDWLGPECAPSPFPGVGSGRTFMMLRAWRPGPDRGESESPSGVADTLEADAEFCV